MKALICSPVNEVAHILLALEKEGSVPIPGIEGVELVLLRAASIPQRHGNAIRRRCCIHVKTRAPHVLEVERSVIVACVDLLKAVLVPAAASPEGDGPAVRDRRFIPRRPQVRVEANTVLFVLEVELLPERLDVSAADARDGVAADNRLWYVYPYYPNDSILHT